MEGPGVKPVENETRSQASRTTKEGKKYSYRMNVIQQPLRARACGSGAKSSADRRPVDPPPIVELKIFEESDAEPRDVTFSMNANYFLFATLEQARNVAQGRVQQDQKSLTVLTGTPVAGMVYLDRPSPAGYFIFPDLSVRHEGKYRLSFSLYEELKEAKDEDQMNDLGKPNGPGEACVMHRLEVKSQPFTVYSAKKFPGLTESTSLSRMVAEQGCRVRIRRDVRMRRRDPKSGKDWDTYDEEMAEQRARMSATPDPAAYPTLPTPHGYMDPARPRSGSNASHQSFAPSLSMSRRPSLQDLGQAYHQHPYGTAPHTPQNTYPASSPYAASPAQQLGTTPFMQPQPPMQPPPPQYQQHSYQHPPPMPQAPANQPGYYNYGAPNTAPPTSQSQFTSAGAAYDTMDQPHRTSVDHSAQSSTDHRRQTIQYGPPPPLPAQSYASRPVQQAYQNENTSQSYQSSSLPANSGYPSQHNHQSSYGSLDGYSNRHAPPEPLQPPHRTFATPPLSARPSFSDKLPPINTTLGMISSKHLEPSSPSPAAPQSSYYSAAPASNDSNKRMFGQVFSERHMHEPLRQGARPSNAGQAMDIPGMYYPPGDMDGEGADQHHMKMEYRRADGRHIERGMPSHHN